MELTGEVLFYLIPNRNCSIVANRVQLLINLADYSFGTCVVRNYCLVVTPICWQLYCATEFRILPEALEYHRLARLFMCCLLFYYKCVWGAYWILLLVIASLYQFKNGFIFSVSKRIISALKGLIKPRFWNMFQWSFFHRLDSSSILLFHNKKLINSCILAHNKNIV